MNEELAIRPKGKVFTQGRQRGVNRGSTPGIQIPFATAIIPHAGGNFLVGDGGMVGGQGMGAQTKDVSDHVQSEVGSRRSQSGLQRDFEEAGTKKLDHLIEKNPYQMVDQRSGIFLSAAAKALKVEGNGMANEGITPGEKQHIGIDGGGDNTITVGSTRPILQKVMNKKNMAIMDKFRK